MPLWSQNITEQQILDARGLAGTAFALLRGALWDNAPGGGRLQDSAGRTFHLAWRKYAQTPQPGALPAGLAAYPAGLNRDTLRKEVTLSKALSVRAGLVAALEPTVLSLAVEPLDASTSRLTVTLDKPGSVSLFVKRLSGGAEAGLLAAADGADGGNERVRTLDFPRQSGSYRVVVRAGMTKYARDYSGDAPTSALSTYASGQSVAIKDDYPKGVVDGRRAFAEAMYPLADPHGFDSAAVLASPDWDSTPARQSLIDTVARKNAVDTARSFLNALVGQGAPPYDTSSQDAAYLTSLAAPYAQAVYRKGGVGAYHDVYTAYPSFAYDTASSDAAHLAALKDDFVAKIQDDVATVGYNQAYAEVYAAARDAEITGGVPEGHSAWSTAAAAGQAAAVARHLYDAGFLRAAQEIYDQGLPDGFDWRARIDPNLLLGQVGVKTQYRDLADDFRAKLQAVAKSQGLKHFLETARTQYGYAYDHANAAGRGDEAYADYLASLRDAALTKVFDAGREGSYRDLYDAGAAFHFTYNAALDAAGLAALKESFLGAVYSYATAAALQEVYDLAAATYFNDLTSYPSLRDSGYAVKPQYLNPTAAALRTLRGDYFTRVYESGVIYTYANRVFPLAEPYGFSFDRSQKQASYYAGLEPTFVSRLTAGKQDEGRVLAFKAVYDQVPSFGALHPYANSSDAVYLDSLKDDFLAYAQELANVQGQAEGYAMAYDEVYQAARSLQLALGLPEGYAAWDVASPRGAEQAARMAAHLYNAGGARALQGLFGAFEGAGFSWRELLTDPAPPLEDPAALARLTALATRLEEHLTVGLWNAFSRQFRSFLAAGGALRRTGQIFP